MMKKSVALLICLLLALPLSSLADEGVSVSVGLDSDNNRLASNSGEIVYEYAYASSELTDKYGEYPAWKAFDGKRFTVWSEAANDSGIGESLSGQWSVTGGEWWILGVAIRAGHQRNEKLFYKNNRPCDIRLYLNGAEYDAVLADERDWQRIIFSDPIPAEDDYINLTVEIESVYPGSKYDDTCITSLDLIVAPTLSGYDNSDLLDTDDSVHLETAEISIVDQLMTETDFFSYYPDYESIGGQASSSYINDDGGWTWWTYLVTGYTVDVYIDSNDSSVPMLTNGWTDSEILTDVPVQSCILCYGYTNQWALCEYNGIHGWIDIDYLSYQ